MKVQTRSTPFLAVISSPLYSKQWYLPSCSPILDIHCQYLLLRPTSTAERNLHSPRATVFQNCRRTAMKMIIYCDRPPGNISGSRWITYSDLYALVSLRRIATTFPPSPVQVFSISLLFQHMKSPSLPPSQNDSLCTKKIDGKYFSPRHTGSNWSCEFYSDNLKVLSYFYILIIYDGRYQIRVNLDLYSSRQFSTLGDTLSQNKWFLRTFLSACLSVL